MESKWPTIWEAFQGFKADAVTNFSAPDLEALANDTRVIRNRRKLEAVVENARRMLELEGSYESFDETVNALRKQFKFLGERGCYFFLYVAEEEVPSHEQWVESR